MERAPLDHALNFDRLPDSHYFRLALAVLVPNGSPEAAFEALFDGRAKYDTISNWRYGRRHAPQWANQLLADKLEAKLAAPYQEGCAIAQRLRSIPERLGLSAGAKNLAAWHARRKP